MINRIQKEFNRTEVLNENKNFQSIEVFGKGYEVDGIILEETQGALNIDYIVSTLKESLYFNTLDEAIEKVKDLLNIKESITTIVNSLDHSTEEENENIDLMEQLQTQGIEDIETIEKSIKAIVTKAKEKGYKIKKHSEKNFTFFI